MKPFAVAALSLALVPASSVAALAAASPEPSPIASAPVGMSSPGVASSPSGLSPDVATSPVASVEDPKITALAASLVTQAQTGKIDRSLFDAKMQSGLTPTMLATMSQQMDRLGKPQAVRFETFVVIDGYRSYHYRVGWRSVAVDESFALGSDGKIVGWYFQPAT